MLLSLFAATAAGLAHAAAKLVPGLPLVVAAIAALLCALELRRMDRTLVRRGAMLEDASPT